MRHKINFRTKFGMGLILTCFFVSNMFAADYYVAMDGDDNSNGNEASPWQTIQKAAITAIAGDHIYIKRGTYSNNVVVSNSGTTDAWIEFDAYPGHEKQVILNAGEFRIHRQSYIRVSGIRVQNSDKGFYVEGPNVDGIIISNNHTYNTFGSGIVIRGVPHNTDPGDYNNIRNVKILNNKVQKACNEGWNECITLVHGVVGFEIVGNEIYDGGDPINGGEGIDLKYGVEDGIIAHNYLHHLTRRAIYLDGSGGEDHLRSYVRNVKIYNNVCHDNDGHGLALMTEGVGDVYDIDIYNNIFYNSVNGPGFMYYKHPFGTGTMYNLRAYNNTIYGNKTYGILVNFPGAENLEFYNNISYGNGSRGIIVENTEITESNNLFDTDPMFADVSTLNFSLKEGSPAIDSGTSFMYAKFDYLGNPRIDSVDLGAFEYGHPLVSPGTAEISQDTIYLEVNNFYNLDAKIGPENVLNKRVNWYSADESIAEVDSFGVVTANSIGDTKIYFTTHDGELSDTCFLRAIEPLSIKRDIILWHNLPEFMEPDDTVTISIKYEISRTRDLWVDLQNKVNWTNYGGSWVRLDPTKDSVSFTFSPVDTVRTEHTYRFNMYLTEEGKNWEYAVGVTHFIDVIIDYYVDVKGVELTPDKLFLEIGQKQNLSAVVFPDTATDKGITFHSLDSTIAEVSETGRVTAIATGSTKIIVETTTGGYTDTCDVTVPPSTAIIPAGKNALTEIRVFPNPAKDAITIDFFATGIGEKRIRFFNTNGQLVKEVLASENSCTVEINELVNGLYMIQISNAGEENIIKFLKE